MIAGRRQSIYRSWVLFILFPVEHSRPDLANWVTDRKTF